MLSRRVLLTVAGGAALATDLATASWADSKHPTTGDKAAVKIGIALEDTTIAATLDGNPAARDFLSLLPLSVVLEDYAATEKIFHLPRKLTTSGLPDGYEPRAGDIAYYAPWGNIAIFYKDFRYSPGLVKLGVIDTGLEALVRGASMKATVAPVP